MRFITCRLPDGVEDPAILSADGRQVWPLSWLGLSYETLSDAIPFLTPQVRAGLSLAIAGIPALPIEAVTLESPIPAPAQDVICLGINYMAHSDEAEKYSADAFATQHQDAIYFSKRVTRAVPDGGFIRCFVNGEKRQDSNTGLQIFNIDHVIAELSQGMTLRAGTIIATGTPAGVGMGMDPPRFLVPGDEVRCEIEGIGTLTNTVR